MLQLSKPLGRSRVFDFFFLVAVVNMGNWINQHCGAKWLTHETPAVKHLWVKRMDAIWITNRVTGSSTCGCFRLVLNHPNESAPI